MGPIAVVDLETTGLAEDAEAEILEFGAVCLDPGAERVRLAQTLVRPGRALPPAIVRLTGLRDADVQDAARIADLVEPIRKLLQGRTLVAHNATFERHFLARFIAAELESATYLDSLDLLALTHPDAPDLRLASFSQALLGREERHRALADAVDTLGVLSKAAVGARAGEARYRNARRALESFAPTSPWLSLLGKEDFAPAPEPLSEYVEIGEGAEDPVPFDEEAIAAVLADEARGRRHFPNYRPRSEQIQLARRFVQQLATGGVLLLEGGTGVGKSLAYLSAAIPFLRERAAAGDREPVVISTRTKLLQDQLLSQDIPRAARMFGFPELRAMSIKGRANYICARRLETTLAARREPSLFPDEDLAYAALFCCARTRPHGEVGALPAALQWRFPRLRDLLGRSVATRPEQCRREDCARQPSCPFGLRRAALSKAHLVVANHDLLLRWPPDYPRFSQTIVDEVHELPGIADEVFATEVRPQEIIALLDEIFGWPGDPSRNEALLPRRARKALAADAKSWRRDILADLTALGRCLAELGEFGALHLPPVLGPLHEQAGELARNSASRLEQVCEELQRRTAKDAKEGASALERAREDLRAAAAGLRLPFDSASAEQVAAFEGLTPPFDRWRLVVRTVDPSPAFHERFLERLKGFAGVSASLFVGGDSFAALGELRIEHPGSGVRRESVPSPFPYERHMRVLAFDSGGDLVEETAAVLADLALRLGGRTLGLFTSLRRMRAVAEILTARLAQQGIDILLPRTASDDPQALVTRFSRGDALLLGSRKFWQGLDIPGPSLQAVVIEKLPFEVPTELRRRRESRLREQGENAFQRYGVGKMLLNLKQMSGRLIRSEEDRGVVVIVEGRTRMRYFKRLGEALPEGVEVRVGSAADLPGVLDELGIGRRR